MITGTAIEYSWAVDSSTPSGSIDNYTETGRVSADTHTTVSYSYNSGTVWNGGDVDFTSSATIDSKISVMADTTLNISEGATLTLNKGMIMASGATLTVEGGGTLIVSGIAGANGKDGNAAIIGKTVINGATVNVTGGSGKNGGNGITGNVVLNSGALRAVGGAATTGSVGTAVAGTITKNDKTIINKVNSATESIVTTATVSKPLCETYGDGKSADAVITGDTTIVVRTIYTDADNNESDTAFTAAGTYTATIYGADNSTASVEYTIKQKDISGCTISAISEQKYTGSAITPAVTVKDGSDALKVNTDYTVAYSNNKNVGKATVTITGIGNYTGTNTAAFKIVKPDDPKPAPTPDPDPTPTPAPNPTPSNPTNNTPAVSTTPKPENKIDLTKPVAPDKIDEAVKSAKEGDTVKVDMTKSTTLPDDALKAIKGKDVTVELDMGNGVKWTINGKDVTDASKSIDMSVTVGTADIPVDVINNVSGERYNMVISLAHNGDFGFKATLTIEMRKQDVGLYANLYYYNPKTDGLEYISCGQIKEDGTVDLDFSHASDYTIIVDDHPLGNEIKAAFDGSSLKLTWGEVSGAESYTVYQAKDGKWVKLKTTGKTALTLYKLSNNKTYRFMVRAKVGGKLTPKADSYKITVKMCYKPVLKATAGDGKITLKWSAVNNAEKYAVYKYVNGAWTFVKETKKLSLGISGVRSGKTYKYAVCAYVNNDWTKIGTASTATIKVK